MRPTRVHVFAVVLVLTMAGAPAMSQPPSPPPAKPAASTPAATQPAWMPPAPGTSKKDWIRLKSGEWLTGEIEFLRDEEMEFDSDELDLQKLDWEDVAELRSPRLMTYAFMVGGSVIGTATLRDSVLRVLEDGQVREFPRSSLLSIVQGKGNEWSYWSGKFSLGLIARSGNTDQADANSLGSIRRDGTHTRFDVNYAGNLGRLEGVENVNNHLAGARFDVFISRRLFVTPVVVQFYSDHFQNIELRTTIGASVGYYLIRRSALEWFVLGGVGYLSTRNESVAEGEEIEESGAAFIPAMALDWDIVKDLELDMSYVATIRVPETHDWVHHFTGLLTIENLKIVDLTMSITWDRVARPVPREDGTVPESDDLRTTFGIAVDF